MEKNTSKQRKLLQVNKMIAKSLTNAYIQAIVKTGAIQIRSIDERPFTLRSGRKSYIYINHSILASSEEAYKICIDAVKSLVQKIFQKQKFVLCNVDSKISAQMVGSLAYILNKPQIIFKSKALTSAEKGPGQQLTGNPTWNLPVAIIDDVMTGGDGTAVGVAKLIKQYFLNIGEMHIFVGLVRNKTFQENVVDGIRLHAVLNYETIIKHIWNSLSASQQKAMEKELQ